MVAIRWRARSSLGVAAFVVFVAAVSATGVTTSRPARAAAGDDDLALDLSSASDKTSDAGPGLRKLELRRIPKGTFVEGSSNSDQYREPDEVQRTVTISKTFWMSKYPVTRAQFARFVAETRHQTDAEKGQSGGFGWDGVRLKQDKQYTWRNPGFNQTDDDPVTLVTFGDANAFTAWASRKTGRRVRLPTEAEFEYAARAGTTSPWYAAKSEEEAIALGWYRPQPGQQVGTHPVGRKKPNAFGLYDMSGNVNEWCRDVYAVWPAADVTDPENTTNTSNEPEKRVLRGGSWLRDPKRGRSAQRYRLTPGTRNADNGFRVVVEDAPAVAPSPGQAPSADLAPSALPAPVADAPSNVPDGGPIIQATPVIQRPPSSEGISWTFFAAPIGAIAFVLSWMLVRRKHDEPAPQGITTRAGEDGFWVRAPNLVAGSRVRYTCIVKGVEVSDIVSLEEADETFVFTDGTPSLIHVSESIAVPGGHRSSARMLAAAAIAPPPSSVPRTPAAPPMPGSVSPPPAVQVSPWPSDRGSVRSVGAVPAAAPSPVVPPAPSPVVPPAPISTTPPTITPPIPAISAIAPNPAMPAMPAMPAIPPPAPSSRPVGTSQPPPVPSSSRMPPAPPAAPSSARLIGTSSPPAAPSSARLIGTSQPPVPPPLPSRPPPLSKAPLPPAVPSAPPGPRESEPPGPRSSNPLLVSPIAAALEKKAREEPKTEPSPPEATVKPATLLLPKTPAMAPATEAAKDEPPKDEEKT